MLSSEQQIELAKKLRIWSVEPDQLATKDLNSYFIPATYVYEQTRGGKAIIVGNDGKILNVPSSAKLEDVIDDIKFKNLWYQAEYPVKKVTCPKCGNITTFDLTKCPTDVKFDYKCEKCGSFHMIKL